ncbi:MAG: type II toxin-antitoxin system RelB/DinJ family antitoxin [Candidatus Paceibacterota bacterium]
MKTVINIKTDKEIKERAQQLAKHLGVPLSTVVNAYLKEFVNSGRLNLEREPVLKKSVSKELLKQINESKEGKNISPTFNSHKEAIDWLNS